MVPYALTTYTVHLQSIKDELKAENIRISSVDDKRTRAVLMVSTPDAKTDYYLYEFADKSVSPLVSAQVEVVMIQENPSRIRVELVVVDERYQQAPFEMARVGALLRTDPRSGFSASYRTRR